MRMNWWSGGNDHRRSPQICGRLLAQAQGKSATKESPKEQAPRTIEILDGDSDEECDVETLQKKLEALQAELQRLRKG